MKRISILSCSMLPVLLLIAAVGVSAKDPASHAAPSLFPSITHVGSLTPPPKEWAMFPQDEPPPQAPQTPAQAGQNPTPSNGQSSVGGSVHGSSGVVSAAHVHTGPHREMPLLWMLLTGALSLGAIAACGSLIVQKGVEEPAPGVDAQDIQEVSEALEVTA